MRLSLGVTHPDKCIQFACCQLFIPYLHSTASQFAYHNIFFVVFIHGLEPNILLHLHSVVCFLHCQRCSFISLTLQQFEHFHHKLCTDALTAIFLVKRNRKRRCPIIYMTIIIHDPCLDRSDHLATQISKQAVIAFQGAEIIYIHTQFGLFNNDVPLRRLRPFGMKMASYKKSSNNANSSLQILQIIYLSSSPFYLFDSPGHPLSIEVIASCVHLLIS